MAQACLDAGADDLGGTLMNESISTAAGAPHGHFLRPADIRALIFEAGRVPVERSTTYQIRRVFEREPEQPDALDLVESADTRFGSYPSLIFVGRVPLSKGSAGMTIAIVGGTGAEGTGLGLRFARAGARVRIGSRDLARAQAAAAADRRNRSIHTGRRLPEQRCSPRRRCDRADCCPLRARSIHSSV